MSNGSSYYSTAKDFLGASVAVPRAPLPATVTVPLPASGCVPRSLARIAASMRPVECEQHRSLTIRFASELTKVSVLFVRGLYQSTASTILGCSLRKPRIWPSTIGRMIFSSWVTAKDYHIAFLIFGFRRLRCLDRYFLDDLAEVLAMSVSAVEVDIWTF